MSPRMPRPFFVLAIGIGMVVYGLVKGAVAATTDATAPDPDAPPVVPDAVLD